VADTAEVAETAYVGPHAMVLDQARVLDNAVIEDYVIAYGDVVFKDNARAFGKLAVKKGVHSGNSRMYIRNEPKWSGQEVRPEDDTDAPQKRLGPLTGTAAFQANYECFQPEGARLLHSRDRHGLDQALIRPRPPRRNRVQAIRGACRVPCALVGIDAWEGHA